MVTITTAKLLIKRFTKILKDYRCRFPPLEDLRSILLSPKKLRFVEESDEEWPEEYKKIYGTDKHEWNNYQEHAGEVLEFLGSDFYLKQFQAMLKIPHGTSTVRPFMYMAQIYNSQITNEPNKLRPGIEGLYWTVLCTIRYEITGDDSATDNFNCINPVLLREMQNMKPQLDFTNRHGVFNDKFHLLNDTLIPYNYFQQFNGMYLVRALNEMYGKKDYIFIHIFADCTSRMTIMIHCEKYRNFSDNYYFFTCPSQHS